VVISLQGETVIDHDKNKIDDVSRTAPSHTYNIPYLNQLSKEEIHQHLLAVLPSYMVPDSLVAMDRFPLTVNGKLDKRALPDPEFGTIDEYVAPTNETEASVCKIWEEVLGVKQVGTMDNFFQIGGNSILAIQVSHRMNKALKCKVKVSDLFKHPVIIKLISSYSDNDTVEYDEGRI
jgi:hypothetical protein